jgi:hypothetical protein
MVYVKKDFVIAFQDFMEMDVNLKNALMTVLIMECAQKTVNAYVMQISVDLIVLKKDALMTVLIMEYATQIKNVYAKMDLMVRIVL